MTATLEDAIVLATQAHAGQVDKAGEPYILHPLRVMMRFDDERGRIVAVLHDVVEDTAVTFGDLMDHGFPDRIVEAVSALTRQAGESYGQFIDRVSHDSIATRVKIADLEDNMDIRRLTKLGQDAALRQIKYHEAWRRLKQVASGVGS